MGILEYNEIVPRKYIIVDGDPYEVIASHSFRKQQRKPVNQTKLKNMLTGKVTERAFHQTEKAEEAELESKKIKYLFINKGQVWFCEESDPSKRFSLEEDIVGNQIKYIKPNSIVESVVFNEKIIGFKFPIKVDLKVKEAMPAEKGNTVQGGSKEVTLETGATIHVPLFINQGDIIRINTETEEYTERVGNSY